MKKNRIYSRYFVLPGLALYIVFFVVPGLLVYISHLQTGTDILAEVKFVGLENYRAIFASGSNYLSYMRNTLGVYNYIEHS